MNPIQVVNRPPQDAAPSAFDALAAKGWELQRSGDAAGAGRIFSEALAIHRNSVEVLYGAALCAIQCNDLAHADRMLHAIGELAPLNAVAHQLRSHVLVSRGRHREAQACFDAALLQFHDNKALWAAKAQSLLKLREFKQAVTSADKALHIDPQFAAAHALKGHALARSKKFRASIRSFDDALRCRSDFLEAWVNKGVSLVLLAQAEPVREDVWRDALACFERALQLKPGLTVVHKYRAMLRRNLHDLQGAIADYERVLVREPRNDRTWSELGMCRLYAGEWRRGWAEWERRLDVSLFRRAERARVGPRSIRWRGEPLQGKTLLLHEEGGFGDTIQFARFVLPLAQQGIQVRLQLREPLQPLLAPRANASDASGAAAQSDSAAHSDYHCSFMSLPHLLGVEADGIPGAQGYLQADPLRVAKWCGRLGPQHRPRVGIAWSGNPRQLSDAQRSMALAELAPVLGLDLEFICLQKVIRTRDKAAMKSFPHLRLFCDEIADFADTAALCEMMDVIVTTCTSVAHLAGAMGKPVWIMLARNPCWRWQQHGDASPWYGSARLYRQQSLGDWAPVVERVRMALTAL